MADYRKVSNQCSDAVVCFAAAAADVNSVPLREASLLPTKDACVAERISTSVALMSAAKFRSPVKLF